MDFLAIVRQRQSCRKYDENRSVEKEKGKNYGMSAYGADLNGDSVVDICDLVYISLLMNA